MDKFKLDYLPGGWVRITWKGIEISRGRPWIKDKDTVGYSELLLFLWENQDNVEEEKSRRYP